MPIHDWTRVDAWLYHDFQLGWTSELSARLNQGILPSSHFALTETIELRPSIGFQQLPEPERPFVDPKHSGCTRDAIPNTRYTVTDLRRQYVCVGITIRHTEHHQPIAAILWITGQDKQTPYRFRAFVRTAVAAITHGIHVLIVDLFPPSVRDPQGIHKAIWDELTGEPFEKQPEGKPLAVASYDAGDELTAYVEPLAVGDNLPEMPLFLEPGIYVPTPLETTYLASWSVLPGVIRELVEPASAKQQRCA